MFGTLVCCLPQSSQEFIVGLGWMASQLKLCLWRTDSELDSPFTNELRCVSWVATHTSLVGHLSVAGGSNLNGAPVDLPRRATADFALSFTGVGSEHPSYADLTATEAFRQSLKRVQAYSVPPCRDLRHPVVCSIASFAQRCSPAVRCAFFMAIVR